MHLVFWHNIVSPHQSLVIRELSYMDHRVVIIATEAMSEERKSLGWEMPDVGNASVIISPNDEQIRSIVEESSADTIHLIAGARGTPLGRRVAHICRDAGCHFGIVTEAPDPRGISGFLRMAKYSLEQITIGRNFEFVLAMGVLGERWFERCGYDRRRIFPYAYVTSPSDAGLKHRNRGKAFRFAFAGRLVSLKGVDLALLALAKVADSQLVIIGDGPERERLALFAERAGVAKRVEWRGQMSAEQVRVELAQADILLLPSRKDGWGAVVNESLNVGTPVICSNACGAADLLREEWLGSIFESENVQQLAEAMQAWRMRSERGEIVRERIKAWSACIDAPVMADYLLSVLRHVYENTERPQAPWRTSLE